MPPRKKAAVASNSAPPPPYSSPASSASASSSPSSMSLSSPSYVIINYENQRQLIAPPSSLSEAIETIKNIFEIEEKNIDLVLRMPPHNDEVKIGKNDGDWKAALFAIAQKELELYVKLIDNHHHDQKASLPPNPPSSSPSSSIPIPIPHSSASSSPSSSSSAPLSPSINNNQRRDHSVSMIDDTDTDTDNKESDDVDRARINLAFEQDAARRRLDMEEESFRQLYFPDYCHAIQRPPDIGISVKTVDGKTLAIVCRSNDTIATLKYIIHQNHNIQIPPRHQRIRFGSNELENHRTLHDYGIRNYSVLHLSSGE